MRQKAIFDAWINKGAKGYLEAVTGFGKTRVGEMAIARCFEKDVSRVINILVPHKAAQEVWEEVKERSKIKRIRVCMAHTYLSKSESYRKCDLLIIDEAHRFTNETALLFGIVMDETDNKWVLPLSASYTDEQKDFMRKRGIRRIGYVGMEEAKECGYVAEHETRIVDMFPSYQDEMKYNDICERYHKLWGIWKHDMDEIIATMSKGTLGKMKREQYAEKLPEGVDKGVIYNMAKEAMNVMNERKVFLRKAPSKVDVVELIANKHKNQNIISFGEYTDIADLITERLGSRAVSYHSNLESEVETVTKTKDYKTEKGLRNFMDKNKGKLTNLNCRIFNGKYQALWTINKPIGPTTIKKRNMDLFTDENSPVNFLSTAKSLDESANIPNVEIGILWSYTGTVRQIIQRLGRLIRYAEGKFAYIYILCMRMRGSRSQEERWLAEALEGLDTYVRVKVAFLNEE